MWNQPTTDMLQLNLSDAEIQRLKYERYHYPCPIVQKRIDMVYYKATLGISNKMVAKIIGCNHDTVRYWVHAYEDVGFEALCSFKYGTNKSDLENHTYNILKSFEI